MRSLGISTQGLYKSKHKMKIEIKKELAYTLLQALELYLRIGIGQFGSILEHPSFDSVPQDEKGWSDYTERTEEASALLAKARNILIGKEMSPYASYGIHNSKVDDSCREAYDMLQVLRHSLWKNDEDRAPYTLASSVHLTSIEDEDFKCEL